MSGGPKAGEREESDKKEEEREKGMKGEREKLDVNGDELTRWPLACARPVRPFSCGD